MNAKNIKLVCSVLLISLILFMVMFYYNRNSAEVEFASSDNNLANEINSNDLNEEALVDENNLNDSKVNESSENEIVTSVNVEEEQIEQEETVEQEDIELNAEKIIGNDLPIEHSPEHSGSFVIINSVGYEKFKFNKYNANVYVDSVNKHAKNINNDVVIYNLITPTSSEFNMPDEYRDLSGSQKDGISYAYLNMDNKVITVDAYSNMDAHKDEYLYFKTDHHWTSLGAYRAYEAFMKAKGQEAVSLEKYKRIDSENKYLGSIYNMTGNERLENNLDDIWYYKPLFSVEYSAVNRDGTKWSSRQIIFPSYFDNSRKYSLFMGGDTAFSHIKVDSQVERKILVIKDSYGNAFIPFLLPHYGDIFVADPRYFSDNIYDVIKDNKIDEVLIINYATTLQLPAFSQMIGDMGVINVTSATAINATLPK